MRYKLIVLKLSVLFQGWAGSTGAKSRGMHDRTQNSKDRGWNCKGLSARMFYSDQEISSPKKLSLPLKPASSQAESDRNMLISLPRSFFQDLMRDLASDITSSSVLCFLSAFTDIPMRVDCKGTPQWNTPEQTHYLLLTEIPNNHNKVQAMTKTGVSKGLQNDSLTLTTLEERDDTLQLPQLNRRHIQSPTNPLPTHL